MKIHSKGTQLGFTLSQPVFAWVTLSDDADGASLIRVTFDRVPLEDREGRPVFDLKEGEVMIGGCGGIYR